MPTAVQVSSTPPVLRLAVIEFETPAEDVFVKHGTYGDIAAKLLRRTLTSAINPTPLLKVTKVNVLEDDAWPNVADIDAVLVTGSKYTASDNDPWVPSLIALIQQTYNAEKPLAGICYGHQMIARALGGRTSRNPKGWEVSVCQVDMTPQGAKLFGTSSVNICEVHRDAVIEPPPNAQIIGSSALCDVQVMYQPGRILGFQGHPEFDKFITESFIQQRLEEGILDQRIYEDAMSRIEQKHDGELLAIGMCKFFLGYNI